MRSTLRFVRAFSLLLALSILSALPALADCPGNRVPNPGFEDGAHKGEAHGTSISSWVANGWVPWSLKESQEINREPEYKMIERNVLDDGDYRVHSGNFAFAYFTGFATHTSGFYQRIPVPPGSRVTFSIWAQINTGQNIGGSKERPLSDLEAPGGYRVWAGIDPYGDVPPGFGAPASGRTVWSQPVLDIETRQKDANGNWTDAWVELKVSTIAQSDHVTIYARGEQEWPVKVNISFWDDACLIAEAPPTKTPRPPTATPEVTETPVPTETAVPTETPEATETLVPTETPVPPTATPIPPTDTPVPTDTPAPTETPLPTLTEPPPTLAPTPVPPLRAGLANNADLAIVGAGMILVLALLGIWIQRQRKTG